ncbi:MAG: hypothetical protein ACHQX1_02705 [Candidatus Micrarchaeales archaeon]
MKKIIPQVYRYPLFFAGLVILVVAGMLNRYFHIGISATIVMVIFGFLIFVISIVA